MMEATQVVLTIRISKYIVQRSGPMTINRKYLCLKLSILNILKLTVLMICRYVHNVIKIISYDRSLRLLLKDLMKPHIKVKSGDLSIRHDHNVMPMHIKLSDWLNTTLIAINTIGKNMLRTFDS